MAESDKGAAARQRILEAAALLVARFGLEATTLEAIASRAHLSKATLYHYFPDGKASIFREAIRNIVESIWDHVESQVRAADGPTEAIFTYFRLRIEVFDREVMVRGLDQQIWQEIKLESETALAGYFKREHALLSELIESAVAAGEFREGDADLGARLLQSALKGLTYDGPLETTRAERQRDLEHFIDLLCHGFRGTP